MHLIAHSAQSFLSSCRLFRWHYMGHSYGLYAGPIEIRSLRLRLRYNGLRFVWAFWQGPDRWPEMSHRQHRSQKWAQTVAASRRTAIVSVCSYWTYTSFPL